MFRFIGHTSVHQDPLKAAEDGVEGGDKDVRHP